MALIPPPEGSGVLCPNQFMRLRKNRKIAALAAAALAVCQLTTVMEFSAKAEESNSAQEKTAAVYESPEINAFQAKRISDTTPVQVIKTVEDEENRLWYQIIWGDEEKGYEGYILADQLGNYTVYEESDLTKDGNNTYEENLALFPEDYQQLIENLHAQHPNWIFIPFETGLTWDEVVEGESVIERNLVSVSSVVSMKSMEEGCYDWETDTWIPMAGPNWVQASRAAVSYYLDPRNFITEEGIFMHELLSYNEEQHTVSVVEHVLQNTFMGNTIAEGSDGKTYAEVFVEVGREYNVSPVMLASRCRQEQGVNGSAMTSGTVEGYEGYYNYFNIRATGTTQEEIIHNAMEKAKQEGWTSPYLSIKGGALILASNYIMKNQDTLYLQKFDVDAAYNGLYLHQYMQSVAAPSLEARSVRNSYISMDMLESNFVFKIPVYENMPENLCPMPVDDRNPNNYLSSIEINNGEYGVDFDYRTFSYSLEVPHNCTSLSVTASTCSATAELAGTGTYSLAEGENTIPLTVTAQTGENRVYTVHVLRQAGISIPFTDVQEDDWFYEYVYNAYNEGLMNGTSATTFSPHVNMTREMIVTVLYRMAGEPEVSYQNYFVDVADGEYYSKAVTWAQENGIVTGYGDGVFGVGHEVTREQLVVMLYRYGICCGLDVSARADLSAFGDQEAISDWAEEAMEWAVAEHILSGNIGAMIYPGHFATRAEGAKMLYQFYILL